MNNRQIHSSLADANPVPAESVACLSVPPIEAEILADPGLRPPVALGRQRALRHGLLAAALSTTLAAAGVALLFLIGGGSSGQAPSAYAAPLLRFAESTPLILIGAPGWHVEGVQPYSSQEGEMQFFQGHTLPPEEVVTVQHGEARGILPARVRRRTAELNWYGPLNVSANGQASGIPNLDTASEVFRYRLHDWISEDDAETTASVLGTTARIFLTTNAPRQYFEGVALWVDDGRVLEFRSPVSSSAAFKQRLASLQRVDSTSWLDAMPSSVVKAVDQPAAIRQILKRINLPPGFSAADVPSEGLTTDHYQLGATVVSSVACTWFARWASGRIEGNRVKIEESVHAMTAAKHWPILREMSKEGDYPQVLEGLAAAMRSGHVWRQRPLRVDVESALSCGRRFGIRIPESQLARH